MIDPALLETLSKTLQADPRNGPLWMHYGDLLVQAGRVPDALAALRSAAELPATRDAATRKLLPLLREYGHAAEALIRAEAALARGEDPALREELARIEAARGRPAEAAQPAGDPREALAGVQPETADPDAWAAQFEWGDLRIGFGDVAGLEDVKRQIRLRIIAPFQKPGIYDAFRREGGGGILLFGPPGCGKTFIARATAGELGARFVSVSIHDVLDKYWGETEKLVHGLFERARRNRPTVLFFDEFDALGSARRSDTSSFLRTVVDQILQEMDGIGGRNRDVLLMAATNAPWSVDSAFRRPGRFDRVLFVPPPDEAARRGILERHLRQVPGGARLDLDGLARRTDLFSGADLRALCERAGEDALERSLADGKVHEIAPADAERALAQSRSTLLEWLATARNYARYSNDGGQYDELATFLQRVRRW